MNAYPRAVRHFGMAALQDRAPAAPRPQRPAAYEPSIRPSVRRRTVVRLWIPLTPLFWILAPFPLLLAPLAWLTPAPYRPANPYRAVFAIGRLLTAIGGTLIHVDTPDALVSIRIL